MTNTLKTTALLAALTALLIVIGDVLGGRGGMLLFFGFAIILNMGAYWFSGDIALRMAGAQEVTPEQAPELHQLVQELSIYARLPMPRVAIIDNPSPNAFATGRDANHAVVAVTTGILGILNRDELAGVLGHELGHVRNHDILISSIAATVAGAITMLAHAAQWAADETGARIQGNPETLARALEKLEMATSVRPLEVNPAVAHMFIVNPLKGMSFAGLFSTHPPLEERIRRLRTMQLGAA